MNAGCRVDAWLMMGEEEAGRNPVASHSSKAVAATIRQRDEACATAINCHTCGAGFALPRLVGSCTVPENSPASLGPYGSV